MKLHIVMVEPQIPQNTGNIARTCSVTGAKLHLVGPMAFKIEDKYLKRAGLDYWHELDITYYNDIYEFFNIVTEGQLCSSSVDCIEVEYPDTSDFEFYYVETHAPHIYTEPSYKDNSYLFFGSETKGLDDALLYKNPKQCVRFPMLHGARSMNLSSAVAVGVFEVLRQWGFPNLQNYGKMAEDN